MLKYATFHRMADGAEIAPLVFLSSRCLKAATGSAEGPARAEQHLAAISLLTCSLIGSLLRLSTLANRWLPSRGHRVWRWGSAWLHVERQSYTETACSSFTNTLDPLSSWRKLLGCVHPSLDAWSSSLGPCRILSYPFYCVWSQRSRLFFPPKGPVSVNVTEPDASKEEVQVKKCGIISVWVLEDNRLFWNSNHCQFPF